jgi:hypothetical protein
MNAGLDITERSRNGKGMIISPGPEENAGNVLAMKLNGPEVNGIAGILIHPLP